MAMMNLTCWAASRASSARRVEGMPGEHVQLVDHVNLVAALDRRIHRLVEQRGHVVHAAVGGGVHLNVVGKRSASMAGARGALIAQRGGGAGLAVERLGKDAPRWSSCRPRGVQVKQYGVVEATGGEGVGQRTDHVSLPDERLETARAPLAGKDLIGHGGILSAPAPASGLEGRRTNPRGVRLDAWSGGEPTRRSQGTAVAAAFPALTRFTALLCGGTRHGAHSNEQAGAAPTSLGWFLRCRRRGRRAARSPSQAHHPGGCWRGCDRREPPPPPGDRQPEPEAPADCPPALR